MKRELLCESGELGEAQRGGEGQMGDRRCADLVKKKLFLRAKKKKKPKHKKIRGHVQDPEPIGR